MNCGVILVELLAKAYILSLCVPGPFLSINQPLFIQQAKVSRLLKKVGLGYEFELQRIQN